MGDSLFLVFVLEHNFLMRGDRSVRFLFVCKFEKGNEDMGVSKR